MMRADLPGLAPLTPPPGGPLRLRQALEARGRAAQPWYAAAAAACLALLVAELFTPSRTIPTLSSERVLAVAHQLDATGWIVLDDASKPARIWVALPAADDAGDPP